MLFGKESKREESDNAVMARTLLLTIGLAMYLGWASLSLSQTLPKHEFVPDSVIGGEFSLTDHTGRHVTKASYNGNFVLVYFGFTHRPDVCPTGLFVIASAMEQLGEAGQHVRPLFVTVGPGRDSAELLANYVTAFHPSMVGLTTCPPPVGSYYF